MKKSILAGVLILVILVAGYFSYKTIDKRTEEKLVALENIDTEEFERITGIKPKKKYTVIPEEEIEKARKEKEQKRLEELRKQEEAKKKAEEVKRKAEKAKREAQKKQATNNSVKQTNVSYNKSELQQYAHDLVISYGWSEYDYQCLVKLWNRESGWNPNAVNKKSGACGIPQANPCSKASKGTDYRTNAKTQIRWGLNYIKNRYGSPGEAWSHSQRVGWY